jgi:hypothetical protein
MAQGGKITATKFIKETPKSSEGRQMKVIWKNEHLLLNL